MKKKTPRFKKFIMCILLYFVFAVFIWINPYNIYWCDIIKQSTLDFSTKFSRENSAVTYADNGDAEIIMRETEVTAKIKLSDPYEKRYITINQDAEKETDIYVKFEATVDMDIYNSKGEIRESRLVFEEAEFTINPTGESETYQMVIQPYGHISPDQLYMSDNDQNETAIVLLSYAKDTLETPPFNSINGVVSAIPKAREESASIEVRRMLSKIESAYNSDDAFKFLNSLNYGNTKEEFALDISAFKLAYDGAKAINSTLGNLGVDWLDRRLVAAAVFNNANYFSESIAVQDTVLFTRYYSSEMRGGRWFVNFNASIKRNDGEIVETKDLTLEMSSKPTIEDVPFISVISKGWYTDTLYTSSSIAQQDVQNDIYFKSDAPALQLLAENINPEILAGLSRSSYYDYIENESYAEWKRTKYCEMSDRFSYSIFENGNSIVYAFRGTPVPQDIYAVIDWGQTLQYYGFEDPVTGTHAQYNELVSMLETEVFPVLNNTHKNIYITGHSLGGWLALESYLYINEKCIAEDARKIIAVTTFNTIGISQTHANTIESYFLTNKDTIVVNYYTCCDIAHWYGIDRGLKFPGNNYIIEEPHDVVGILPDDNMGEYYRHASDETPEQLITKLKKVKNLFGKSPVDTGLTWLYYGLYPPNNAIISIDNIFDNPLKTGILPLDGAVSYPPETRKAWAALCSRMSAHGVFCGILNYAKPEANSQTNNLERKHLL